MLCTYLLWPVSEKALSSSVTIAMISMVPDFLNKHTAPLYLKEKKSVSLYESKIKHYPYSDLKTYCLTLCKPHIWHARTENGDDEEEERDYEEEQFGGMEVNVTKWKLKPVKIQKVTATDNTCTF